jgi:predicted CXXCH cytochrome family protein
LPFFGEEKMRYSLVLPLLLLVMAWLPAQDTCLDCHSSLEGKLKQPAQLFPKSIHAQSELTCASCHGGDPAATDPDKAMDPAKGFIGVPKFERIPEVCGSCHSSPTFMKKYNPSLRTDEVAEYKTSQHGKLSAQGITKVATCTSCHSVHDILTVDNPSSPVYPLNVADTCGRCHSNPKYMAPFKIPTDQASLYRQSVHAYSLYQQNDLSAPTCNDCHGDHGATPPGVGAIENVCGHCHVTQRDLFNQSIHAQIFPAIGVKGCIQCHSNHRIRPTSEAMLTGKDAVCSSCHEADQGTKAATEMAVAIAGVTSRLQAARDVLQRASAAGMEVSQPLYNLNDAQERIVLARQETHTLKVQKVQSLAKQGYDIANSSYQAGIQAFEDLRYRRRGLYLSLVIIGLVVVVLVLVIRSLERRQSRSGSAAD